MRSRQQTVLAVALAAVVTFAAWADEPTAISSNPNGAKVLRDEAVGVSLEVPAEWATGSDPVLFGNSYGFLVSGQDTNPEGQGPHDREPIARIALMHSAQPSQIEALVRKQMQDGTGVEPVRTEVSVGGGLRGVAVIGLPGTQPYSVVYVASGNRVYEIGLWTDLPGLDARALLLLGSLRFHAPTRSVKSLGLRTEAEGMQWRPTGDMALRSRAALAERRQAVLADDEAIRKAGGPSSTPTASAEPQLAASACGALAPVGTTMQWQTQWDNSNTFYVSGNGYNWGSTYRGWTAMSGNYGSWWGQNYHWRCADPNEHNQHFANDWPAQRGANVYSHFSGTVKYVGHAQGGYVTLGYIVIVRNGGYSSLSAHLNGTNVVRGQTVDAPNTIIGWAGNTGSQYDANGWAPHIHSRVTYGEYYNGSGMPYGGYTVQPRAFRCYQCTDQDERTPDGRKWYTNFFHGRWMKY